ncbi:hypothetical protein [Sporosarcina sp. Te-1]|nr:hypothetical protein [Sporosarcina sp. Te-1]
MINPLEAVIERPDPVITACEAVIGFGEWWISTNVHLEQHAGA